jgi:hypothetical protein
MPSQGERTEKEGTSDIGGIISSIRGAFCIVPNHLPTSLYFSELIYLSRPLRSPVIHLVSCDGEERQVEHQNTE